MSGLDRDAFAIELRFEDRASRAAADVTAGHASVRVGGVTVWDFSWTWVELLEHLASSWRYLRWEESAPIPVDDVQLLPAVRASAQRYLETSPNAEEEEELFDAFCEAHDLARGLEGVWPPSIWIMRVGRLASVWTEKAHVWIEADAVLGELERAAAAISARLARAEDERARHALRSWAQRDDVSTTELVSIATGLSRELVVEAAGDQPLDEFWDFGDGGTSEVAAAARMVGGPAPATVVREIVHAIRALPRIDTPKLDALANEVERVGALPHEQGIEAARWLREKLGHPRDPLQPRELLASWGVIVESFTTLPAIDAICAWGARHGPAILLNPKGRRARGPQGERSTLAHEIAHLLLDRDGALPVAEVLGGRVPRGVEQRAGAFAAELLLPQEVVREAVAAGITIRRVVRSLKKRYGVSEELIAWQARNGGAPLTDEDRWYLRSLVSEPHRY